MATPKAYLFRGLVRSEAGSLVFHLQKSSPPRQLILRPWHVQCSMTKGEVRYALFDRS